MKGIDTMKNYKILTIISLLATLTFIFTACGSTNTKETTATTASTTKLASKTTTASSISATASKDSTALSSGSYTGTIGNTKVTLKSVYIVDGINATINGGTYNCSSSDQVVFLVVNGGSLTIKNATINKTGNGTAYNSDYYNFYGVNSAIVVIGKNSSATIQNCKITTNAEGANAVFASDSGKITASNLSISTQSNSSRGLYATYGAAITAENVNIVTQGAHCADLATDRGGGTVTVTGTNYLEANGDGSPCVYSTGEINVTGATGSSKISETVVIEGKNSVTLNDCELTSSGGNGIMLYQSMSGDAADSNAASSVSTLTLKNSKIIYEGTGALLYVTNTKTVVNSTNTTFTYKNTDTLINAATGRWGTSGSNGGTLTFNANSQTLSGKVTADSISSVTLNLKTKSTLTGTTSGSVTVNKDSTSSVKS